MSEFVDTPVLDVVLGDSDVPIADESVANSCNYYSSYYYNYNLCAGQYCYVDSQCTYYDCYNNACWYSYYYYDYYSSHTDLVWLWWLIACLCTVITVVVIIVVVCCIKKKKRQQAELQHALYQENGKSG